jgi:hypothetical protein
MIRDLLVDPDVSYYPKRECLATFLEYAEKKSFAIFFQGVVQFYKPRIPRFGHDSRLNTAYWTAYSMCTFLACEKFDVKLNREYKQLCKCFDILDSSNANIDSKILAVLLLKNTGLNPAFEDSKYMCHLLDANIKDYENMMEVYKSIKN